MNADDARREEIARAGQRLESFLQTLGPGDLARQSACEGWTVGDVVGHLIERGSPIPDQIERGLGGDISAPPDALDDPPLNEDQFRLDLDRRAVELRRELGDGLAPEFARINREFDRVLSLVQPGDWDKLCYHRLRPETVRSKTDIRIAELAMHEWDIHWAFDPDAALAEDSLPRRAPRLSPRPVPDRNGALPFRPDRPRSRACGCNPCARRGILRDRRFRCAGRHLPLRFCHLRHADIRQVETPGCDRERQSQCRR